MIYWRSLAARKAARIVMNDSLELSDQTKNAFIKIKNYFNKFQNDSNDIILRLDKLLALYLESENLSSTKCSGKAFLKR